MSSTNRGAERNERDFYPTPRTAFLPLIGFLPTTLSIWEPACGDGRLIEMMAAYGLCAGGSDLKNGYDYLEDVTYRECVVTNPPFILAMDFCDHAIRLSGETFLLLRLNFLGSQKRGPWFKCNEPSALFVLSDRPSFVQSITCRECGWKARIAAEEVRPDSCGVCASTKIKITNSDSCEYAWFYWGHRHSGIKHL